MSDTRTPWERRVQKYPKVSVRMPASLIERVDKLSGYYNRSAFVKYAIEEQLRRIEREAADVSLNPYGDQDER